MSVKLTNEQIKARKAELKKLIEQLSSKTGNPSAYTLSDHQPYTGSPMEALDKVKLEQSLAEFGSLIESFDVATATVQKILTFSDGNYTIKYIPQKNRFDFYIGNEFRSSDVTFSEDGKSTKVIVPTRNSDTHGEIVNYVYTLNIPEPKDLTVKKAIAEPACSKVEEGLASLKQNDEYWKQYGYVKDANTGRMRKPTPEEYCATLNQKRPMKDTKIGRNGLSFSKFLGKGTKK